MSDQTLPDFSMRSRRWNGVRLISSDTALYVARMVHLGQEGSESLAANEPLSVRAEGAEWVVMGALKVAQDVTNPGLVGPLQMRISQFDAQILSYVMLLAANGPSAETINDP